MTYYRAWFQSKNGYNFVDGYEFKDLETTFLITHDPETAFSAITDYSDLDELYLRMFQAIMRRPTDESDLIPYEQIAETYAYFRDDYVLQIRPAQGDEIDLANTTYLVGDARVDRDEFGADRMAARYDNRELTIQRSISRYVLGAGMYVDSETGTRYAGITTGDSDGRLFWALPDNCAQYPNLLNKLGVLPCRIQFNRLSNGGMHLAFPIKRNPKAPDAA